MKHKRAYIKFLRWVARIASAAVTGVMLVTLLLCMLLLSNSGRISLLDQGLKYAAEETGYRVEFTEPHSYNLGWWEFGTLRVSYGKTELARAEKLAVKFDVWNLSHALNVEAFTAQKLAVHLAALEALPKPEETEETARPFQWPDYTIRIRKLELETLSLSHPELKEGWSDYALSGSAVLFAPEAPLLVNADIATLTGTPMRAQIHTLSAGENTWRIDVKAHEDAGGILGAMIDQPVTEPLDVALAALLAWQPETEAFDLTLDSVKGRYRTHDVEASGALHYREPTLTIDALNATYGDAKLAADGDVYFTTPDTHLKLGLTNISLALLRSLGLPVPEGVDGIITADATVAGPLENPQIGVVAKASGTALKDNFTLALSGDGGASGGRIDKFDFTTKRHGSLALSGKVFPTALDLAIEAKQLSTGLLKLWQVDVAPATLSSKLALTGSFEAPKFAGTARYAAAPYAITADFKTVEGQLQSDLRLLRDKKQLGKAALSLPIATYLNHETGTPLPLTGSVKAEAEIAPFAVALDPSVHTVRGLLNADLTFSGTMDSPKANGFLTLTKAGYENSELGLKLSQVKLDLKANESGMTLNEFSATDGGKGRISMRGDARFGTGIIGSGSSINLALDVNALQLVNRHDVDAGLTGKLTLTGSLSEMAAKGTLLISPLHVLLNQISSHSIPTIEVTEIQYQRDALVLKQPDAGPKISTDITIQVNKDSKVQGRGLDTALDGAVKVTGTVPDLAYNGKFKTIDGSYNLFGRKFVLEDGRVEFEDGRLLLYIPGTYKGDTATIRAEIAGTLDELKITLSSTPAMAQEDIISWLLFGKSASNVSPFQAIRLANAVQELRGGKSLIDPVGSLQKALKLDNITVDSDEDSESGQDVTVGIGKYLNDKVYLEVEKGSNPAQPFKGSVEMELRENLTLETETGGDAGAGGVGVKWKRDY